MSLSEEKILLPSIESGYSLVSKKHTYILFSECSSIPFNGLGCWKMLGSHKGPHTVAFLKELCLSGSRHEHHSLSSDATSAIINVIWESARGEKFQRIGGDIFAEFWSVGRISPGREVQGGQVQEPSQHTWGQRHGLHDFFREWREAGG